MQNIIRTRTIGRNIRSGSSHHLLSNHCAPLRSSRTSPPRAACTKLCCVFECGSPQSGSGRQPMNNSSDCLFEMCTAHANLAPLQCTHKDSFFCWSFMTDGKKNSKRLTTHTHARILIHIPLCRLASSILRMNSSRSFSIASISASVILLSAYISGEVSFIPGTVSTGNEPSLK